jgi:hypothetical protein
MLAIQIKGFLHNKHNENLSVPLDDSIKGWDFATSAICGLEKTQIVQRKTQFSS